MIYIDTSFFTIGLKWLALALFGSFRRESFASVSVFDVSFVSTLSLIASG